MRSFWTLVFAVLVAGVGSTSCGPKAEALVSKAQTFAELRTVKRGVTVTEPGGDPRPPHAVERLVDGATVEVAPGGLAWVRRDGGLKILVAGPAAFKLRAKKIEIEHGKLFVDTPDGATGTLSTPRGVLQLSAVRASVELSKAGVLQAYVLKGGIRLGENVGAGPGSQLTVTSDGKSSTTPVTAWEDWTGGLATTDRAPQEAPFGVGTIGARKPGSQGQARFPLSIRRLDVRVRIDGELAVTEVEQLFANPSADTVEGLYSFRTPLDATLHQFGVDRDGSMVWGQVKERETAAAQYRSNVYQGSKEDPALLLWDAPGVYKARLYPIAPGATRRVVTRYAEWLGRDGPKGNRRLYVYPMAAEGAEATLPRIEEMRISLDLKRAGADSVRVGLEGKRTGSTITVQAYDFVPRADFAVELYDGGVSDAKAYQARHTVDLLTTPKDQLEEAQERARAEAPYVLVPVRPGPPSEPPGGLDLAILVDTSAATNPGSLAIARAATHALMAHLGPEDRVALWAGDATLRPVAPGSDQFAAVDAKRRDVIATALAQLVPGGATDLGAVVTAAASKLDSKRRHALVYIGDGRPTVGETGATKLRERLTRLPNPVRVFSIGIGDRADLELLERISQGGLAMRVSDASGAALAALRLLEIAERPVQLDVSVDLGPGVDRIFPQKFSSITAGQSALVVGRVVGKLPESVRISSSSGSFEQKLERQDLDDHGDLRRRWAEGRLSQLISEGASVAAVVELGVRSGIVTPKTSLYVPTAKEAERERNNADSVAGGRPGWNWLWVRSAEEQADWELEQEELEQLAEEDADNKEGGTGTRAKGEEGSMGRPSSTTTNKRYGVRGPANSPRSGEVSRNQALKEAKEFGLIGLLDGDPPDEPVPAPGKNSIVMESYLSGKAERGPPGPPRDEPNEDPKSADEAAPTAKGGRAMKLRSAPGTDANEVGKLGFLNAGAAGDSSGGAQGNMWAADNSLGTETGTGQGFGSGHGRLGGSEKDKKPPRVRMGNTTVTGSLPKEVISRILRQNFRRFRACYQAGLRKNPKLEGRVAVKFIIDRQGNASQASNSGSDIPDAGVVTCVARSFASLSFPQPESGRVLVNHQLLFSPGSSGPGGAKARDAQIGPIAIRPPGSPLAAIGHQRRPCSAAASLPYIERAKLWRERLVAGGQSAGVLANIYRGVLSGCEAPTWSERSQLLLIAVRVLRTVRLRVDLWRRFVRTPAAADVIYRAILTGTRSAADIRELHEALGIKQIDKNLLRKSLARAKTASARVALLQGLVLEWPDDLSLALRLLDAFEDAKDDPGGKALARRLRRRSDASTQVRTAVAEYYFRLAARSEGPVADGLRREARRTFGEIVEFAPNDPLARRLLADLLRAHGWFEKASRQYETLARLVPDDARVPLLRAATAQGMGRTEEAVRWTERAAEGGAPDPGSAQAGTARAFASVFLAWSRHEARSKGDEQQAKRLLERARRLTALDTPGATSTRVTLTWAHPELHPELWSGIPGSLTPADRGDPALGISLARLPGDSHEVEIRLSAEDAAKAARLGAEAVVTTISGEGTTEERIDIARLKFQAEDGKPIEKKQFKLVAGKITWQVEK